VPRSGARCHSPRTNEVLHRQFTRRVGGPFVFSTGYEGHRSRSQDTQERRGAWIKEQKVIMKNGKIAEYRVDLKVTFIPID
jgi:hypothetical protein